MRRNRTERGRAVAVFKNLLARSRESEDTGIGRRIRVVHEVIRRRIFVDAAAESRANSRLVIEVPHFRGRFIQQIELILSRRAVASARSERGMVLATLPIIKQQQVIIFRD